MSARGRSPSPRSPQPKRDDDVDMDALKDTSNARVVVITNLTRNVAEVHLRAVFGYYGEITKVDLPLYAKSGQNRGKASLEFSEPANAQTAASHMNGGQLDGSVLKVELSDLPIRTTKARSRSRSPRPPPPVARNGPPPRRRRSFSRSPIRSRSRSPGYGRRSTNGNGPRDNGPRNRYPDSYPARPLDRRGPPPRNTYRRSRSRSPPRRNDRAPLPRRRSPSYERGGYGRGPRGRSRSRSYDSLRSSRSRSRTPSRSRSRSRARSYSPYSKASSRSRSRSRSIAHSRSGSRARRSRSKDDIRGSKSRSPP